MICRDFVKNFAEKAGKSQGFKMYKLLGKKRTGGRECSLKTYFAETPVFIILNIIRMQTAFLVLYFFLHISLADFCQNKTV